MNRTQLTLAGILALQILLILVLRSPFSGAAHEAETERLLPGLEAVTPDRLELVGANEERVELRKSGDEWRLASLDDFPADGGKVTGLIETLERLEVRRPVVSSSRYHESFKVADDGHEGRVRVWSAEGGEPRADLILGDSSNYRLTHVRRAGDDRVYEVRGLSAWDVRAQIADWIRKELVDVREDQVVGITLTNPAGTLELEKEDGEWRVRAPQEATDTVLDPQKIDDLLRAATDLRLTDAAGVKDAAAHGFDDAAATVALRWTPDGVGSDGLESAVDVREVIVQIGRQLPDDSSRRYVTRPDFEFSGTIWDSTVKQLIESDLSGLSAS